MERERDQHQRERAAERRGTLTDRQVETMREIGRFRLVNQEDLARFHYAGRTPEMSADLLRLIDREHLVERRVVVDLQKNRLMAVLVLTARGKAWLEGDRPKQAVYDGQKFFDGFVRAREVYHDAEIYPAYQATAKRLLAEGSTIQRVVLDHELKGIKARLTNRRYPDRRENSPLSTAQKQEVARELHLTVVKGKIHIPDAQIHYRNRDGEDQVLNLEVTTSSYRGRDLRGKTVSGFSLFSAGSNHAGAPVWDDHHLWR